MTKVISKIPDVAWKPAGEYDRRIAELEAEVERLREALVVAHRRVVRRHLIAAQASLEKALKADDEKAQDK